MMTPAIDYRTLYDDLRDAGYHADDENSTHLRPFIFWITHKLDFQSVLDIGCSSGGSLPYFEELGRRAWGIDASSVAVERGQAFGRPVIRACATRLPFVDNSFDLVVSSDTYEHLDERDVPAAVDEARRVAHKYLFLKIATREDRDERWKQLAGHALHLTIRPLDWWIEQFGGRSAVVYRRQDAFCMRMEEL